MKIQIDTDRKTIKLESDVLLSKLVETLDKLLPNKEWKKFTLETHTVINNWNSPIVIREYPTYPKPYWPWYGGNYYGVSAGKQTAEYKVQGSSSSMQLKSGVYNVEL